jgi:hypothetical protein
MAAWHLVALGAALESCAAIDPGCVEQRFHWDSAFGGEYTLSRQRQDTGDFTLRPGWLTKTLLKTLLDSLGEWV